MLSLNNWTFFMGLIQAYDLPARKSRTPRILIVDTGYIKSQILFIYDFQSNDIIFYEPLWQFLSKKGKISARNLEDTTLSNW